MERYNFGYADVEWGPDEAKGDYGLGNYFVEYPGFRKIISGKKRYIIGRKGTGKSAILQKIITLAEDDSTIMCIPISLRNFPISQFRDIGDKKFRDKSKYVPTWRFLILVELAKLIIADCSIPEDEIKMELRAFINTNFPQNMGMVDTITMLKEQSNKISIISGWLTGEHAAKQSNQTSTSVHFKMAGDVLEQRIYSLSSQSKYYILADELDEGYKENDSNLRLIILSLLRACEELAIFFSSSRVKCYPLVALRSDIFDNLEDNDLNKLDDYVLRLEWTIDDRGINSLKRIVESRIRSSFYAEYPDAVINDVDLWNMVFDEHSAKNGLWKYMSIHTFDRPRDIIKMLKYCQDGKRNSNPCLDFNTVSDVEIEYSSWLYREFRDEIQSFLPCWKAVLNCITEISYGKEKVKVLENAFLCSDEISAWLTEKKKKPSYIIEILFDYSVIGCINEKGRWIFKYKENHFEYMESYPYYCVHYGFCKKLRIVNSYRPMALAEIYYSNR